MATRPNFIDLRSHSHGPFGSALPSPSLRGLPSPRLHVAGDIPPELSPLDAFAAQSRLLAKQLDETRNGGRRVSRLPPLAITHQLNQNRPGFFRSLSAEAAAIENDSPTSGSALKTEVETPGFRPVSVYPQMSGAPPAIPPSPSPRLDILGEEEFRGRRPRGPANPPPFFGARREQSPTALEKENILSRTGNDTTRPRPSAESARLRGLGLYREHDGSCARGYDSRALAPPPSPYMQRTPSPKSMSDSSDDGSSHIIPGLSPHRRPSAGSGMSTSPISPSFAARSPSISSEISVGGTRLPRPSFNFSRPISRASASGILMDVPSRQASSDSQPSFILADETANTPVSMHSEGFPGHENENGGATSYVYSRFALPRGKMLQRTSIIFLGEMPHGAQTREQSTPSKNFQSLQGGAPPSPPSRPSTSSMRPSFDQQPPLDPGRASFDPGRPSFDPGRPSYDRGRPPTERGIPSRFSESTNRPSSASTASSSTIKASPQPSLAPSAERSAEEHVSKAIEFHEQGALTKSTYHLRLAARQNHPTGMLLYALACRHGWGMRPNQKEGVAWLRRAVESASLEVTEDEELEHDGKAVDLLEKKARKAQFALSVYELGVSHMNGWGIDQDKTLALRCFEIAGSWGDADALAEAGFCYAQGHGCKKDLKKSARLYRQAEAKGISMVGNSWIYKSKYMDDTSSNQSQETQSSPKKEKKPRDKSRTRTLFHRSKTSS